MKKFLITSALLAAAAGGTGLAPVSVAAQPAGLDPSSPCRMSADAVEHWSAAGAELPACIRVLQIQFQLRHHPTQG